MLRCIKFGLFFGYIFLSFSANAQQFTHQDRDFINVGRLITAFEIARNTSKDMRPQFGEVKFTMAKGGDALECYGKTAHEIYTCQHVVCLVAQDSNDCACTNYADGCECDCPGEQKE